MRMPDCGEENDRAGEREREMSSSVYIHTRESERGGGKEGGSKLERRGGREGGIGSFRDIETGT